MKRHLHWLSSFFIAVVMLMANVDVLAQEQESIDVQQEQVNAIKSVHIFPNPASEFVHIRFEKFNTGDIRLSLFNIIGNEMRINPEVVSDTEFRIRIKDLDAGYYLIALKDANHQYRGTYKFLKK